MPPARPHPTSRRRRTEGARSPRRAPRHALLLALAAAPLAACSSGPPAPESEPVVASVGHLSDMEVEPETLAALHIGGYLQELDKRLRSWSRYKLEGRGPQDQRKLESIAADVAQLASARRDELVEQLEAGPPINRAVAAMALGFTKDPSVQSPLLAALSDHEDRVVANALLGLGMLGLPDTPVTEICYLLRTHPEGWTRSNAAYALQSIVAHGGGGDCVLEACRDALLDEEPGARSQAAIVLGLLGDADSVPQLGERLEDDVPLVVSSAAHALGTIGAADPAQQGAVARLLASELDRVPRRTRPILVEELEQLSGSNLGDSSQVWRDWAFSLP